MFVMMAVGTEAEFIRVADMRVTVHLHQKQQRARENQADVRHAAEGLKRFRFPPAREQRQHH